MRSSLRVVAPALVLGLAAVLRFWALGRPDALVFDELFYVRDAISQLAHGFPTTWPDDEPDMSGDRAAAFSASAANAVHPPLGKWLIGLGVLLFGAESGWGWRSAVAAAGVATVAVVMHLGWRLTRSFPAAIAAGFILAIDGVHIVLTRVALLDGLLAFGVALGALLMWRDVEARAAPRHEPGARPRVPIAWRRPWLLAAAAVLGAAAAVKWSGLYALAFFLVFVTVADVVRRIRLRERRGVLRACGQAAVTAAVALPTATAAYLASWIGWIVTSGGWMRQQADGWFASLVAYHANMLEWHGSLSAPHPYQAAPLTWPLALRPTAMYSAHWSDGCPWESCAAAITAAPNPLVTWGGVAALLVLAVWVGRAALRPRARPWPLTPPVVASAFVLVGYLSGWLPWLLTFSRSAVFQFYAVVLTPFAALALAMALAAVCGVVQRPGRRAREAVAAVDADALRGRRIATALFLTLALALALLFFPIWSGMPVADWFWRAHLWLPGWR